MPASIELWVYGAMTGELLTMARGGPPKHKLWAAAADGCQWAPALGKAYQLVGFLPQIPTLTDQSFYCSNLGGTH